MPEVVIKYDPSISRGQFEIIDWLVINLGPLVADHLGIKDHPEAALSPEDVELEFRPTGLYDVTLGYMVQISVNANDYPERRKIARSAAVEILSAIVNQFPDLKGNAYVWVRLSFGEFVDSIEA